MELAPGTRFGVYEVLGLLGAGGMGEVYRARDARLGRSVALKILPDSVAADRERVARFEREAKVLASLNHPNIATLYGIEQHGDRQLLVMELVEGETLAERLQRGPMPIEEAVPLTLQICEALEAAHAQGIVHRDLKPANVKITPDGRVKVLDFGLAKAVASAPAADVANSPTLSMMASEAGLILGTAAYMSPEQARGMPADHRSDVFAFGVVLYEVLTGQRSFGGETVPDVLASVLARETDLSLLPRDLNPRLKEVIARCLQKSPRKRWQAIGDVRLELESLAASPRSLPAAMPAPDGSTRSWLAAVLPLAAAAVIGGVAVGAVMWALANRQPPGGGVTSFSIVESTTRQSTGTGTPLAAMSPDGRRIVYQNSAGRGDAGGLYLRPVDQVTSTLIPGTEGARSPFFSPDGEWIGFFAQRKLLKVSVGGGLPTVICDAEQGAGGAWAPDGTIVFGAGPGSGLSVVGVAGGRPRPLTTLNAGERSHRWPIVPAGGNRALFVVAPGEGMPGSIDSVDLKSGTRAAVIPNLSPEAQGLAVSPTGHLLYAQNDSLFAIAFDTRLAQTRGTAVPVLAGVGRMTGQTAAQFALSATGTLVYEPDRPRNARTLEWMDRRGVGKPLPGFPPRRYVRPRLSPDGKSMAVVIAANARTRVEDGNLFVGDLARGTLQQLTRTDDARISAEWTPDGRSITYSTSVGNRVHERLADGTGEEQTLANLTYGQLGGWTPDGRRLVLGQGRDIAVWSRDDRKVERTSTPALERLRRISPDGQWIAFTVEENPGDEVYIQPIPSGPRVQASIGGGAYPVWGRSGQLHYLKPVRTEDGRFDDAMMVVEVSGSGTAATIGPPRELFRVDTRRYQLRARDGMNYDVTRDGERFLVVREDEAAPQPLLVIVNWVTQWSAKVR